MQAALPPIVELVVGVQFSTERPVDSPKIVLFWDQNLRKDFPNTAEAPALEDAFEKFDDEMRFQKPSFRFEIESLPRIRFQFTNLPGDRMVQLQSTRIIINWLRAASTYPRFSQIHAEFKELLQKWKAFAEENRVGEVAPNQWELTYVNFIPQGQLWTKPGDWHKISPLFASNVDGEFEPLSLEDRRFEWRMRMPANRGRITVSASQAKNELDQLGLRLMIIAKGPAMTIDESHACLQESHNAIIRLFDRVATSEAKSIWGML